MLSSALGATLIPCTTLQIYPQAPQLVQIFFGSDQSNSFRCNSILQYRNAVLIRRDVFGCTIGSVQIAEIVTSLNQTVKQIMRNQSAIPDFFHYFHASSSNGLVIPSFFLNFQSKLLAFWTLNSDLLRCRCRTGQADRLSCRDWLITIMT